MTIEATGERFIPELMGGQLIEAEHVARYALAAQLVPGRRVLDAGCGVGWGAGLLLAAGASSVSGIDLDPDAVVDARQRVPGGHFVQGDLARLPWDAASFDVVVCLETIEHVAQQDLALDEVVRVLTPDGLLIMSSPNPRVYPAGNPFHLRELTPEELTEAVAKRLPNVVLWNQHSQIASVLVSEQSLPPGATREVLARIVAPLEPGSDVYSLVIAGRGESPTLPPLLCCAPSDQLLQLEALGAALSEESQRLAETHRRLLAERSVLMRDAAAAAERIASLERQTEMLRRQREHTAALLLESEQQLADALAAADAQLDSGPLTEQLGRLYHEINVLQTSKSWRLTAPLRALMRLLTPKR